MSLHTPVFEAEGISAEPKNSWEFDFALARYQLCRNHRDVLLRNLQTSKEGLREALVSGDDPYMWQDLVTSGEALLAHEEQTLESLRAQISTSLGMRYVSKQFS